MLTSERLKKFIAANWHAGLDLDHSDSPWLKEDLQKAIENHEFEPKELEELSDIDFDEQNDVDVWVHWIWTSYFPDDPYPGKIPERKRHTSLTSERLEDFIAARCDVDEDISEVTESLRKHPDGGWALWLKDDLRQAIENKELKPKEITGITNIAFDDQAAVDKWSRDIWTEWFPEDPYPG